MSCGRLRDVQEQPAHRWQAGRGEVQVKGDAWVVANTRVRGGGSTPEDGW